MMERKVGTFNYELLAIGNSDINFQPLILE